MKSLLIVVGVFTIVTVVRGFDANRAQQFHQYMINCSQEMGEEAFAIRLNTFTCALRKDGQTLDENGFLIKNEILKLIEDVIYSPNKMVKAKKRFNDCYDIAILIRNFSDLRNSNNVHCIFSVVFLFET